MLKYDCHINTEVCSSISAIKYLYKYITKGSDGSSFSVNVNDVESNASNEIRHYQDLRSIGAAEGCLKTFEFPISKRYPAVKRLPIHLENQQPVMFNESSTMAEVLSRAVSTELTAFFITIVNIQEQMSLTSNFQRNSFLIKDLGRGVKEEHTQ